MCTTCAKHNPKKAGERAAPAKKGGKGKERGRADSRGMSWGSIGGVVLTWPRQRDTRDFPGLAAGHCS